jgi:hypothetical protein
MYFPSRRLALVVAAIVPVIVLSSACEDSSSPSAPSVTFEAGAFDATPSDGSGPTADAADGSDGGAVDSGGDAGQAFAPKTTCDVAKTVVDYAGNDFASRPIFASAPGSPVVAFFNRVVSGSPDVDCEQRILSGTTWGSALTLQATTCSAIMPFQVAAGGNAVLAAWTAADVAGQRQRVTAGGSANVGSATTNYRDDLDAIKMGAGGHGAHVWRSPTGVAVMLISNTGTTATLPENTLAGGINGMSAAVDASGDGFAFWVLGSTIYARAFKAGAWASPEAMLTSANTASGKIDATILPGGDAYVVAAFNDGTGGVRGAKVQLAAGTTTFGPIEDLETTKLAPAVRILATADGELTALWGENDGSGNFTLTARRRSAAAWTAASPLGKHQWDSITAAIDASGHVTVGRNPGDGTIFHHRIGKGSTVWSPGVRVDAASGGGTAGPGSVAIAIEPATGNPVLGWVDANDLKFSICH